MGKVERFVYVVTAHRDGHVVGYSRPAGTCPTPVPLEQAKIYLRRSGAQARADRLNGRVKNLSWVVTEAPVKVEGTVQQRFCLVGDDSGHMYAIPVNKQNDWYAFLDLPDEDPKSWDVPDWANRIEGNFTFTDPRT